MSTETATRDDVNRLSDTVTKLDDRAIKAAVEVGSLKATMEAVLKQSDKVVGLLQGNGQRGLVKTVATHTEQIKAAKDEIKDMKLLPRRLLWVAIGAPAGVIGMIELFRML
jgi:hypothetical protein